MFTSKKTIGRLVGSLLLGLGLMPWVCAQSAGHTIRGIAPVAGPTGPTFNLYAAPFNINLPEGSSLYMWGFGDMNSGAGATHPEGQGYYLPQYPGPTMIVTEGQTVTINVTNFGVPDPVSLMIPGQNITSSGTPGFVTDTTGSGIGGTASYTFTAGKPGTYVYHSMDGDNPGIHTEMGLLGALIVRPADGSDSAFGAATGTDFDQEYLYLLTEADPGIHAQMESTSSTAGSIPIWYRATSIPCTPTSPISRSRSPIRATRCWYATPMRVRTATPSTTMARTTASSGVTATC
ncbi:MAG: multicopper oxidase domain-containing protein [Candidatus Thiodiazotropha sp.]